MNTHTGNSPHVCRFCGLTFKQPSAKSEPLSLPTLALHLSMMLTTLTPAMHERVHTGEKPLECEICGMRFSESSNLSKHRKTHNVRGDHVCALCNKDFTRLDQLERHMKTVHDPKNPKNTTTTQRTKRAKKEAVGGATMPTPNPSDSEDSSRRASDAGLVQHF